jgi:predicted pyridoxine 5'-phosphate oxidase superfamily flavin-nucleotide-binding protein
MSATDRSPDGIAFSASVQSQQTRLGSRRAYAGARWPVDLTADARAFIEAQTSVFLATAGTDGQPYIQHRGGPAGFMKVLGPRTLAFADLRGNRQYISLGNQAENDRVHVFLIDYADRRRVKIWGRARVVEDDPDLVAGLLPDRAGARAERAIVITVEAWDVNCPQHIPQRFEAADVARALEERDARIRALESEIAVLGQRPAAQGVQAHDL